MKAKTRVKKLFKINQVRAYVVLYHQSRENEVKVGVWINQEVAVDRIFLVNWIKSVRESQK